MFDSPLLQGQVIGQKMAWGSSSLPQVRTSSLAYMPINHPVCFLYKETQFSPSYARASGSSAKIISKTLKKASILLPSKKIMQISLKGFATTGVPLRIEPKKKNAGINVNLGMKPRVRKCSKNARDR